MKGKRNIVNPNGSMALVARFSSFHKGWTNWLLLSRNFSQTRGKLDGTNATNDKIFDKILKLFEERGNLPALEVSRDIGKSREHTQRAFFRPLIDSS